MPKESAGLLMYRCVEGDLQFLLVHPGGPFWQHKDNGAWTIPKGEIQPDEPPLAAALREFEEELGFPAEGAFHPLPSVRQQSGKIVHAWAFEGNCDPHHIRSNTFTMEWPAGSGRVREFPEIDRADFFTYSVALEKINPAQTAFLREAHEKHREWRR